MPGIRRAPRAGPPNLADGRASATRPGEISASVVPSVIGAEPSTRASRSAWEAARSSVALDHPAGQRVRISGSRSAVRQRRRRTNATRSSRRVKPPCQSIDFESSRLGVRSASTITSTKSSAVGRVGRSRPWNRTPRSFRLLDGMHRHQLEDDPVAGRGRSGPAERTDRARCRRRGDRRRRRRPAPRRRRPARRPRPSRTRRRPPPPARGSRQHPAEPSTPISCEARWARRASPARPAPDVEDRAPSGKASSARRSDGVGRRRCRRAARTGPPGSPTATRGPRPDLLRDAQDSRSARHRAAALSPVIDLSLRRERARHFHRNGDETTSGQSSRMPSPRADVVHGFPRAAPPERSERHWRWGPYDPLDSRGGRRCDRCAHDLGRPLPDRRGRDGVRAGGGRGAGAGGSPQARPQARALGDGVERGPRHRGEDAVRRRSSADHSPLASAPGDPVRLRAGGRGDRARRHDPLRGCSTPNQAEEALSVPSYSKALRPVIAWPRMSV